MQWFLAILSLGAHAAGKTRQLWPLTICEEIHVQELCRGYHLEFEQEAGSLPSMCLWDAKDRKCSVLEVEEGESEELGEICGQYLSSKACKVDARCAWDANEFECGEGKNSMRIPYKRRNDPVYPPYSLESILPPGPLDKQSHTVADQTHPFVPVLSSCRAQRNGQSCYGFSRAGDLCLWDASTNQCNPYTGEEGVCAQYTDPHCGHDLRCSYDDEERICEDAEFQSIPWSNRNDPVYPPYDPRWIRAPRPSDRITTTSAPVTTAAPVTAAPRPTSPVYNTNPQAQNTGPQAHNTGPQVIEPYANSPFIPYSGYSSGPVDSKTPQSPADIYSAVVMFPRWPAFVCSDISKEQMCRGLSKLNTDHICLWSAERSICAGMPINDNQAICGQYGVPRSCNEDQRCKWETHDVLCVPGPNAEGIPISHRADVVYPPYLDSAMKHDRGTTLRRAPQNEIKPHRRAPQNEIKPQDLLMWQMMMSQSQLPGYQGWYQPQPGYQAGYQQQQMPSMNYMPQMPSSMNGMGGSTSGNVPTVPVAQTADPKVIGHKMYAGQSFNILAECNDAKFKPQCKGFAPDGIQMCMWNARDSACKAEQLDEFDEICQQHAAQVGCGLDARCEWDSGDLECMENANPEQIPYSLTLMAAYPPYDPQTVYADSALPSASKSQNGNAAASTQTNGCTCLGKPDSMGFGARCTPNPVSGDTRQYCVVAQGACADQMRASDGTAHWYSFQACANAGKPKLRGTKHQVKEPSQSSHKKHGTNFWGPIGLVITIFFVASFLTIAWCNKKPRSARDMIDMDYIAHTDDYSAYQEARSPRI